MQFYLFKTYVKIGFLFWAIVTLMLLLDRSSTALITLFSAVLHESGHILLLYFFKSPPEKLTLGIFGMRIDKRPDTLSFFKEMLVALAGPLVNIFIFIFALIFYKLFKYEILLKISAINLLMGALNLIPIEPLDGGRAIKNALSIHFDEQRIEKILCFIEYVFLIVLFVLSFYILVLSGYNFTLLIFCVYIFLSLIFKKR